MREQTVKYLRTPNNELFCFFYENNAIYYRIYDQNRWYEIHELAQNTIPCFSLCCGEDSIFVLYQLKDGTIHISRTKNGRNWDDKILFENQSCDPPYSNFFISADKNRLHLIYNVVNKGTPMHTLMYTAFENGQWEKPSEIDKFYPFGKTPFFASALGKHHILLYYKSNEMTVCSREILLFPFTIGTLNTLIRTSYQCIDYSFIADENKIHMLYIIRGFFTCQVIYQFKQASRISPPCVLWEGSYCESCCLFKINNTLWFLWTAKSQPYCCTSDNNGKSFSHVTAYGKWFPKQPIKIEYNNITENKKELILKEIYSEGKGEKIAVIPDVYPDFFPRFLKNNIPSASENKNYKENELSLKLQQHTKQYEALLNERNLQIAELSKTLSIRSDEISTINMKWKNQVKKLKSEKEQLEQKLNFYMSENERLKKTVNYLDEKRKNYF